MISAHSSAASEKSLPLPLIDPCSTATVQLPSVPTTAAGENHASIVSRQRIPPATSLSECVEHIDASARHAPRTMSALASRYPTCCAAVAAGAAAPGAASAPTCAIANSSGSTSLNTCAICRCLYPGSSKIFPCIAARLFTTCK